MIRRTTWILLSIFIALLGGFLILRNLNDSTLPGDPAESLNNLDTLQTTEPLFIVPEGMQILGLEVLDKVGNSIEVKRENQSQEWYFPLLPEEVDQDIVNRVITQLENTVIESKLENSIDKEVVGLNDPKNKIRLLISNGGYFNIYVGEITLTNTSYYAQLGKNAPVIVSKYNLDSAINLLASPPVYFEPTPTPPGTDGE